MNRRPFAAFAAVAVAALLVAGCSKNSDQSSTSSTSTTTQAPAAGGSVAPQAASVAGGDVAHGKQIFASKCSMCHGATGTEGGVGPSLKNEKARKDMAAAIAWIKNPQPPMTKYYPAELNDKDVADVAAFVETL
jgi:mono/diheme cytochrome c family protein